MFHFNHPFVLLLIFAYLFCLKYCKSPKTILKVPNLDWLKRAGAIQGGFRRYITAFIVIALIIALADPVRSKKETFNKKEGHSIALLLDASYSMREDNRFDIAKKVLDNFIKSRAGEHLALEVFGDYSYIASPMSWDDKAVEKVLKYLHPGVVGGRDTALYESLFRSGELFAKEPLKNRVIILLTDGIDTVGNIPLDVVIDRLKKLKIRVYTIGVGDDFRKNILKKIANKTGGRFYSASNPKNLEKIYSEIDKIEKSPIKSFSYTKDIHYYRYPLLLAIVGVLILLFKKRDIYLFFALVAMGVALLGFHKEEESIDKKRATQTLWIGVDISKRMDAKDIYPNRLDFALNRVKAILKRIEGLKVGLILFSSKAYLLSPPSEDFGALRDLIDRIDLNYAKRGDENWTALFNAVNRLSESNQTIPLLIFSTGEGLSDVSLSSYPKIYPILYPTATKRGTVVEDSSGNLLLDKRGDILVTKLGEDLSVIFKNSRGEIIDSSKSIDFLVKRLESRWGKKEQKESVENGYELFYIPLLIALILILQPWRRYI